LSNNEYFKHPTSIIDENVIVGKGTKVWHFCHISSGVKLGVDCVLGQNVFVGKNVSIGDQVKIQNNVSVYAGVRLEDGVFCGPSVVFTNVINPRSRIERKQEIKRTLVREGASLGANCSILCGVTLGRFSLIGAGSVVTKNVPDYALMVGNPAQQIGWICECGATLSTSYQCEACSKAFDLLENKLVEIVS
jgi:UDP-2-acetamido-3-amino-2,3-dideoxy-glucuronate N-acetyltransferase